MSEESPLILKGRRTENVLPAISLGEYFLSLLEEYGRNVALVQQVDGVETSITYGDLLESGKSVCGLLRKHGLGSGDTVMLCLGNTLEFSPILLGTLFVGAALAPVNPFFDPSDMLHLLGVIRPQIIICDKNAEHAIQEALTKFKESITFLTLDKVTEVLKECPDNSDFFLGLVAHPDEHVAAVMCSSGTSGKPKGVELVHSTLLFMLKEVNFLQFQNMIGVQDVVLNLSGPHWVSCWIMTLYSISKGMKLILLQDVNAESFLTHIQKYKINIMFVGPDLLMALAKSAVVAKFDLSSVSYVVYGGAPMSPSMLTLAQVTLKHRITLLYGMTECMGMLEPDTSEKAKDKPCNVGLLGPNALAKVVDINSGKLVGPNCEGELCFITPITFKSYRGNAEATQAIFDEDGYLHTGDVGYYDEDGYFFIVDRIKDLIKYKRDHVPAVDIEDVLLQHSAVQEAAVIGVYHESDWEHATAVVVVKQGESVSEQELLQLVEGNLPKFKWLHGGIKFEKSLPRTASGKIQKQVLKKMFCHRPE